MSCDTDGTRRVVMLDAGDEHTFTTFPLADPVLQVHAPASRAAVTVDLSADGEAWAAWTGWPDLDQEVVVVLPRSSAGVRVRGAGATMSVLEAS